MALRDRPLRQLELVDVSPISGIARIAIAVAAATLSIEAVLHDVNGV